MSHSCSIHPGRREIGIHVPLTPVHKLVLASPISKDGFGPWQQMMNWKGLRVGHILLCFPAMGTTWDRGWNRWKQKFISQPLALQMRAPFLWPWGTLHECASSSSWTCIVLNHIATSQRSLIKPWDRNCSLFLSCAMLYSRSAWPSANSLHLL